MTASTSSPADIVNQALVLLGHPGRVGSLYDGSMAAKKALDIFADGGCQVDRETGMVRFPGHVVEDAIASARLPLDEPDKCDEDTLNRILWRAMRGAGSDYPAWAIAKTDDDDD